MGQRIADSHRSSCPRICLLDRRQFGVHLGNSISRNDFIVNILANNPVDCLLVDDL